VASEIAFARANPATDVGFYDTVRGLFIDVLNMSIEEGVAFFTDDASVRRKIQVLDDLGLGYLTLGQSATTLSGGEAQRVKIATDWKPSSTVSAIPTAGLAVSAQLTVT
jgi:excinuclease UvrABC ATPase subunit